METKRIVARNGEFDVNVKHVVINQVKLSYNSVDIFLTENNNVVVVTTAHQGKWVAVLDSTYVKTLSSTKSFFSSKTPQQKYVDTKLKNIQIYDGLDELSYDVSNALFEALGLPSYNFVSVA